MHSLEEKILALLACTAPCWFLACTRHSLGRALHYSCKCALQLLLAWCSCVLGSGTRT
jgi:hypothetical protein